LNRQLGLVLASVDDEYFEKRSGGIRSQKGIEVIVQIVHCHSVSHGVLDVLGGHTVLECRGVDVH